MRIMMLTGAGISTGAGLSTYRGEDGRYTEIEKEAGMPIEALLSTTTLKQDPGKIWRYWLAFSIALQSATPSGAHQAIAELSKHCEDFLEVTQNVDGLSLRAGLTDDKLIELHGSYHRHFCMECKRPAHPWLHEGMVIPPRCYTCKPSEGAVIRPDVVMFGEMIKDEHYQRMLGFAKTCDVLIISGTSLQFSYLADIISHAVAAGAPVLYIDPEASQYKTIFLVCDSDLDVPEHVTPIRVEADRALPILANLVAQGCERESLATRLSEAMAQR